MSITENSCNGMSLFFDICFIRSMGYVLPSTAQQVNILYICPCSRVLCFPHTDWKLCVYSYLYEGNAGETYGGLGRCSYYQVRDETHFLHCCKIMHRCQILHWHLYHMIKMVRFHWSKKLKKHYNKSPR